jgi:hypothetical protein
MKDKSVAWISPVQNHAIKLWSGNGEEKNYKYDRMATTLHVWLKYQVENGKINIGALPSRRTIKDKLTGLKNFAKRKT